MTNFSPANYKPRTREDSLADGEFVVRELRQLEKLLEAEPDLTADELASRLGESRRQVKRILRMLRRNS